MNLKINDTLPLKYHLNLHLMDSLIERESIAYEIIRYVINNLEKSEKEVSLDNMKFTAKTLKYVFTDRFEDPDFRSRVVNYLKSLIRNGFIKPNGKSMYITKEGLTKFYTIVND